MFHWTTHQRGAPAAVKAAVVVGHKAYYFGGEQNDCDQIEVTIFNTLSLCWTKLPPVMRMKRRGGRGQRPVEVPPWRRDHTAVLIEDMVYIWGGVSSLQLSLSL